MSDRHVVAALQRSVADLELRLREVVRERDEARAEVARLRFVEDCLGDGLTYECNLTRPCVACRLRTVAERQREACAAQARSYAYLRVDADTMHEKVRATPLVTEGKP